MNYQANKKRYEIMQYRRCGNSGLKLPLLSLGLWHNFGEITAEQKKRDILRAAFDCGITYFDLADNYGPPYGSAEISFGKIFREDFVLYRDELIISTKAGYDMWPGPYGDFGNRKHLLAGIDGSLKRMGLDYVDIFYHHRPDPETPMEETADALEHIVRQGKAVYIGISNYRAKETEKMTALLKERRVPFVIHQPSYSMLNRWIEEDGLDQLLVREGVGSVVFKPLEQGLLTGKYQQGIPEDSRISKDSRFLKKDALTPKLQEKIQKLSMIAETRGQSLAQMAIAWALKNPCVTSVLIGASRPEQIYENIGALHNLSFSDEENARIEEILKEGS